MDISVIFLRNVRITENSYFWKYVFRVFWDFLGWKYFVNVSYCYYYEWDLILDDIINLIVGVKLLLF